MRRPRVLFALVMMAACLTAFGACNEAPLDPLPFEVGVSASRATAATGDTVSFVVTAQGGTLFGVEADYGDGIVEPFATGGARTARVTFRHAYRLKGTYSVHVTATDATAGQKMASVEIVIT